MVLPSPSPSHRQFWQERYDAQDWPWDLGAASPHIVRFFQDEHHPARETVKTLLTRRSVFVPGAGRGHDAVFMASLGFDVTALDYAPGAYEEARRLYPEWIGHGVRYKTADLFSLIDQESWRGRFDIALEHTCFCAIPPNKRDDYARAIAHGLKPGGYLLGVFWDHDGPGGPPYAVTPGDALACFDRAGFSCLYSAPQTRNAPGRSGTESLMLFSKR